MSKEVCVSRKIITSSQLDPPVSKEVFVSRKIITSSQLEPPVSDEVCLSRKIISKRDVGKRPNVLARRAAQDLVLTKVLYLHTMGLNSEGKFGHLE